MPVDQQQPEEDGKPKGRGRVKHRDNRPFLEPRKRSTSSKGSKSNTPTNASSSSTPSSAKSPQKQSTFNPSKPSKLEIPLPHLLLDLSDNDTPTEEHPTVFKGQKRVRSTSGSPPPTRPTKALKTGDGGPPGSAAGSSTISPSAQTVVHGPSFQPNSGLSPPTPSQNNQDHSPAVSPPSSILGIPTPDAEATPMDISADSYGPSSPPAVDPSTPIIDSSPSLAPPGSLNPPAQPPQSTSPSGSSPSNGVDPFAGATSSTEDSTRFVPVLDVSVPVSGDSDSAGSGGIPGDEEMDGDEPEGEAQGGEYGVDGKIEVEVDQKPTAKDLAMGQRLFLRDDESAKKEEKADMKVETSAGKHFVSPEVEEKPGERGDKGKGRAIESLEPVKQEGGRKESEEVRQDEAPEDIPKDVIRGVVIKIEKKELVNEPSDEKKVLSDGGEFGQKGLKYEAGDGHADGSSGAPDTIRNGISQLDNASTSSPISGSRSSLNFLHSPLPPVIYQLLRRLEGAAADIPEDAKSKAILALGLKGLEGHLEGLVGTAELLAGIRAPEETLDTFRFPKSRPLSRHRQHQTSHESTSASSSSSSLSASTSVIRGNYDWLMDVQRRERAGESPEELKVSESDEWLNDYRLPSDDEEGDGGEDEAEPQRKEDVDGEGEGGKRRVD